VPDLTTHVVGAYVAGRALRLRNLDATYYLGTILPDVISRPFQILLPASGHYVEASHSPALAIPACLALSLLFAKETRPLVQRNLILGSVLHLLLDALQKHVCGGYPWLFPFSDYRPRCGLIWPDHTPLLLPFLLILAYLLHKRNGPDPVPRSLSEKPPTNS